jgi:hypothetical protein
VSDRQPGQCECGEFHGREACPNEVRPDDDRWQVEQLLAGDEPSDAEGRL